MTEAKILFFDIETSPNLGYYFNLYREDNIVWTEEHWYILSVAWKWGYEKKTHVLALPDYPLYKKEPHNDRELVKDLWQLFEAADIIVAHNGCAFDVKKSNARFLFHKLSPPRPFQQVDTKLIAKRHFRFDSNKLDSLADFLKIGRKLQTGGFKLWEGCLKGDQKSWDKMKKYNRWDVILLEKVYLAMRPYIESHPNLALYKSEKQACPNCGSMHVKRNGHRLSRVTVMQMWVCKECGHYSQAPLKGGQVR